MTPEHPPADDHPDLPARIDAARALSRLSHALVSHRADVSTLRLIADRAERLADQIEAGQQRRRRDELAASSRFLQAIADHDLGELIEDGAFMDLFHDSPVSGVANPLSIGLRIRRDGDQALGTVTLRHGFEGAPNRSHGGIVAACVDETIGGVLPIIGSMAFTGELTLRYEAPCPLGVPLEFRAWLDRREGRKLYIRCEGHGPDGRFVTCHSTFITIDLTTFSAHRPSRPEHASPVTGPNDEDGT